MSRNRSGWRKLERGLDHAIVVWHREQMVFFADASMSRGDRIRIACRAVPEQAVAVEPGRLMTVTDGDW